MWTRILGLRHQQTPDLGSDTVVLAQEVKAGGSEFQGRHLQSPSEFKASLGYMKFCLTKLKQNPSKEKIWALFYFGLVLRQGLELKENTFLYFPNG